MNFILLDGKICIVTYFDVDRQMETAQVGSSTLGGSSTVVTGQNITGEMFIFRQGELPEIFRDDGVVKKMDLEFRKGDTFYTLEDVIFTSLNPKPHSYEKCEAAYAEFAAMSITADEITKSINSRVSI